MRLIGLSFLSPSRQLESRFSSHTTHQSSNSMIPLSSISIIYALYKLVMFSACINRAISYLRRRRRRVCSSDPRCPEVPIFIFSWDSPRFPTRPNVGGVADLKFIVTLYREHDCTCDSHSLSVDFPRDSRAPKCSPGRIDFSTSRDTTYLIQPIEIVH